MLPTFDVPAKGLIARGRAPNPRLGPRRDLLPDLPRPLRAERHRPQAGAPGRVGRTPDLPRIPGRRPHRRCRAGLDYLVDLGINAIYFTPIFQSASNHRYHTHDYEKVDPMLGGNPALRRLIDEAHARGIRVVLDGVFNHASRGFFQFHDILENGPNSAYLDWFTREGVPAQRLRCRQGPQLPGLVGPARPAEVQHRFARSARVPLGNRPELDRVRHRRLAARRPQRDRRRRLLARVPPPRPCREPRGVHRRRGLDRRPALAPGRHVGRGDELPVHPRLHRLLHR